MAFIDGSLSKRAGKDGKTVHGIHLTEGKVKILGGAILLFFPPNQEQTILEPAG